MLRRFALFSAVLLLPVFTSTIYAQNSMPGGFPGGSNQIQEVQPPVLTQNAQAPAPLPPLSLSAGTPEELERRGDELRELKDFLQALDYFNAALKKRPTAVIQNKIGMTYISMGRYDKAKDALKRATKMDKQYAEAFNNLGVIYHMTKKYNDAIKNYRKALAIRESASFHSNLGTTLVEKKRFEEGMVEYRRAFELDPAVFERSSRTGISARMSSPEDRARFSYLLAKLYAGKGDFDKSLLYLRRAMEDGYGDIDKVYTDSEFAALRSDERFTELMAAKPASIPQ